MKRIFFVCVALLALTAVAASAQMQGVPLQTALQTAIDDINVRLGTNYTWDGGQIQFVYEELRVDGNNLGCPVVAPTNQTTYVATIIQFDTQLDDIYEWQYHFAYEADGTMLVVLCDAPPGGTRIPRSNSTAAPTRTATATETSTPTPTITPTAPPIQIGRDGPRVLPPLVCNGLPTRLVVGSTGRVIVGEASNNVRSAPDRQAPQVGDLFPGAVFEVVDGPFCIDEIAWFAVAVEGELRGWTAEGSQGDYFLEPILTDAALIMPSNAALLQPVGAAFAAGTLGMSAVHGGYFVSYDGDSAQVWTMPQENFTSLALSQWQLAGAEIIGQHNFVHRDFTGRIWTADALNGTLLASNETGISPFALPVIGGTPVLSIDMESNAIAVQGPNPNSIAVYTIDRDGGGNTQTVTFALNGPVRDVAFWPDGMGLYAATDTEISMFTFELGDGWRTTPATIFAHDLPNPRLATSLDGSTVAVTGTRTDGIPGLRVYNVNMSAAVPVAARAAINGEAGTSWSRPAVSPDGMLAAFSTSRGTTRVADTTTGATLVELTAGGFGPVAFSTDGLLLLVPAINQQIQMYGVAIPPSTIPTATFVPVVTNTLSVIVVTSTPTFGPIVVTATPTFGPIVVTATPTTAPTQALPTAAP